MAEPSYTIVGENIHCTRIRLTAGKFVETLPDGRSALRFNHGGSAALLPIPEAIVQAEEWQKGKVRHIAVAVRQGLYGNTEEREAGIAYLQTAAREQADAGATFLDVNVDEFSMDGDEKLRAMTWLVKLLQQACPLPLSIDSSNADILAAGIAACDTARGKPLVNSVSLERAASIPVAAAARAKVVAGASGVSGMPTSTQERLDNIAELITMLEGVGIARADIYLDPLVFPISVDGTNGLAVLDAIAAMRETYGPEIHFAPGLSNVSFGMPNRTLINQVFAYLCRQRGCDGAIVDPRHINSTILDGLDPASEPFRLAEDLLLGRDDFGMTYITASREGTI